MYVYYYERELMNEGDSPPIGIVLCANKSESVIKYTLPVNERVSQKGGNTDGKSGIYPDFS